MTTDTDTLVARLRTLPPCQVHNLEAAARIEDLEAEVERLTAERDEWRNDFRALEKAIVGDTGLSAMTVAAQARLFRPRAERAEAQLTEARAGEEELREAASSDAEQSTYAEWQAFMGKDDCDRGDVSEDWHSGYDAAILRLRAALASHAKRKEGR